MLVLHSASHAMRALSLDLRQRIVRAYLDGSSMQKVADRFEVSLISVRRLVAKDRNGQSLAPGTRASPPERRAVRPQDEAVIEKMLERDPSLTTREIARRFTDETARPVAQQTISSTLRRMGYTRKKRR